jgi:glycosyltransferase involved in cell wall biosynthesis
MARTGEISLLLERHECGIVIEPGDSTELACQILRLKNDPELCATMGRRARDLLERKFTRRNAITRWIDLLRNL